MALFLTGGHLVAFAFETLAVSTVAVTPTAATYSDTSLDVNASKRNAEALLLTVETNAIRVRWDGTAPTASVGHLLNAGDTFELIGNGNIKNLKMIRQSADASVSLTYSRR